MSKPTLMLQRAIHNGDRAVQVGTDQGALYVRLKRPGRKPTAWYPSVQELSRATGVDLDEAEVRLRNDPEMDLSTLLEG